MVNGNGNGKLLTVPGTVTALDKTVTAMVVVALTMAIPVQYHMVAVATIATGNGKN